MIVYWIVSLLKWINWWVDVMTSWIEELAWNSKDIVRNLVYRNVHVKLIKRFRPNGLEYSPIRNLNFPFLIRFSCLLSGGASIKILTILDQIHSSQSPIKDRTNFKFQLVNGVLLMMMNKSRTWPNCYSTVDFSWNVLHLYLLQVVLVKQILTATCTKLKGRQTAETANRKS